MMDALYTELAMKTGYAGRMAREAGVTERTAWNWICAREVPRVSRQRAMAAVLRRATAANDNARADRAYPAGIVWPSRGLETTIRIDRLTTIAGVVVAVRKNRKRAIVRAADGTHYDVSLRVSPSGTAFEWREVGKGQWGVTAAFGLAIERRLDD